MYLSIPKSTIFFYGTLLVELVIFSLFLNTYPLIHRTFFSSLPESEMQVYLIGTAIGVLTISAWYWFWRIQNGAWKVKIPVAFLPGISFIAVLVSPIIGMATLRFFPHISEDIKAMAFVDIPDAFHVPFFFIIFLFSAAYLSFTYRGIFSVQGGHRIFPALFHAIAVIFIFLLTFYVGYLSIYDHSNYASAINDVLLGNPLLTFPSLYGFLSIGFLSLLFRFIPLTLLNLSIVTASMVTLGFIGVYILGYFLYSRRSLAFVTTVFAIFANWIVQDGWRNSFPQSTVLRFGIWIPLALCIYFRRRVRSKRTQRLLHVLELTVLAIGFFWTFDIGVYLLLAYLLFYWHVSLRPNIVTTIRRFFLQTLSIVGVLLGVFLLINLIYFTFIGVSPEWKYYTSTALSYAASASFWTIPMPKSIFPWITVAPAWLVTAYMLYVKKRNHTISENPRSALIMFIACYAMIQFTYMFGRSTLNNLHVVAIPLVLCLFFLLDRTMLAARRVNGALTYSAVFLWSLTLSYPTYFLLNQGYMNLYGANIVTTVEFIRHPQGTERQFFGSTADLLGITYPVIFQTKESAILSIWDVWYNVLLHRTNEIGTNCLICFIPPAPATHIADAIRNKNFRYLFVDHDRYQNTGQVAQVFDTIVDTYTFRETVGYLDVFERIE